MRIFTLVHRAFGFLAVPAQIRMKLVSILLDTLMTSLFAGFISNLSEKLT